MIVGCNNEITEVHYSGYTIDKIYACGGQLVYLNTEAVKWRFILDGGNIAYELCQYQDYSAVTSSDTNTYSGSMVTAEIGECPIIIKDGAFNRCSKLTGITLPNSVVNIGNNTFNNCSNLTGITLPNSIINIGDKTFQQCSKLSSITIPSGVTSIGSDAFRLCTGLTSITVEATTPPTLGNRAFSYTNDCPIYVPAESVSAYQTAWSTYSSRIQAIQ